ncbi:MAG TPA: hypothetical protein VGN72_21715 [Tepidisphaeraceae bacterium]|nr:hypothetical protein [Tepidisphaeraceae bacterium]
MNPLDSLRGPALVLFWLAFYGLGSLVFLISLRSFGKTAPVAMLLQAACLLWFIATVLHLSRSRFAYAFAGGWVLLLGLPLAFQVVKRLHYWITIGMEPPDGMGSPMAFLLGFIMEWAAFLPLCLMLIVLVLFRPWRGGRPVM